MVADAPGEKEALEAFLRFADGRILVAHNAHAFDIRFLKAAAKRSGISFEPTYIDTLTMAQAMYPGLHNYKQGTINKHLELPSLRGPPRLRGLRRAGPHLLRHAQ